MPESIADKLIYDLFPGYKLSSYQLNEDQLKLELDFVDDAVCPKCGTRVDKRHDTTHRIIKDVTAFGRKVQVDLPVRRIECPYCGTKGVEQVSWLSKDKYSRITKRLSNAIIKDLEHSDIKHVAKRYDLNWETVKNTHERYLRATIPKFSLGDARILAVDEFAIAKGHRYATIVIDLETRRCLYVAKNRTKSVLNNFFRLCGKEGCKQIQAVAMDQNAAFDESVKKHCPNAKVVYDLFHVTANYGRDVISAIRLRLAADQKLVDMSKYHDLKKSLWLLLRNGDNLSPKARNRLSELLSANEELYKAYVLKE